jgi:two-component system, NarL family, captular synthesis response regulator RcsB
MDIRIVVADDHPVILAGISVAIRQAGVGQVVGEATSPQALLDLLAHTACDVLVTDYRMPGDGQRDGLGLLDDIRAAWPELPVVVVTSVMNAALYREMIDAGANSLVDKTSDVNEIPQAILAAHRGDRYLSKNVDAVAGKRRSVDIRAATLEELSPREFQILKLFSEGMSVTEIARSTSRGMSTVSQQKTSAMRKLGLTSDAQIFDYVSSRRSD